MAKIWIEEVYNQLSESLITSLRALTFSFRVQNNKIFGKTNEESGLHISANFKGNALQNVFFDKLGEINFSGEEEIAEIFQQFCKSVQDISVNEIDVFLINNTQVEGNTPYDHLIEHLENDSKEFYQEYGKILVGFPGLLYPFFKSDEELFSDIGENKLLLKLRSCQEQMLSEYLKEIVCKVSDIECNVEDISCREFDSQSSKMVSTKLVDELQYNLFGEESNEYLCGLKQRSQCEKFLAILNENAPEFFEGFEYLKQRREEISRLIQDDISHVELLRDRGVYLDTEIVLKSLLDLHKVVTLKDVEMANDFARNQLNASHMENFSVTLSQVLV